MARSPATRRRRPTSHAHEALESKAKHDHEQRQIEMQFPKNSKGLMNPELRRRGIFLLPNALTTAALFAGFYAIVQAMNGRFEVSAVAIFAAMVLDGLDGRVARLTRTQSAFGAEYDSLSDMVSFGAAPALVVYEYVLKGLGNFGWAAAFIYCACAALRLARFNTNIGIVDKRYFQGMPSPAAAALVAGLVWLIHDLNIPVNDIRIPAAVLTIFAGVTMVSNIRFYSGKEFNPRRSVPFFAVAAIALGFALISFYPPGVLFAVFLIYAMSGYVLTFIQWRALRKSKANPIA